MIVGALLSAVTVAPLVGSTVAGAVSVPAREATAHSTLTTHATLACGPITFEWNADEPLTYFQVHATGVSCAVAKSVVAKAGKYHGVPPAGWVYVGTAVRGPNCASTWKRGAARVTGYLVNTQGC